MGLKTVDWSRVVDLVGAKTGVDFRDKELVRASALINSAAQYIFDESRYHPRFLVLEPRTQSRGYIQPTEDSYNVYGAGTSEANGLYVRNGDSADGNPAYTLYDSDGTTALYNIWSLANVSWYISSSDIDDAGEFPSLLYYSVISSSTTPPTTGWLDQTGEDPSPIVQALSEIDEIISYWDGARWVGANPSEVAGYPDQNGFRLTSTPSDVVYVAYKKVLPTEYGDGNQGTTSDFPAEWLNYCAYSAAREWMGSVRRDEAFNPVSLRDVDKREAQVLIKANRQGAFDTIANIWTTRYAKDTSIASRGTGRVFRV